MGPPAKRIFLLKSTIYGDMLVFRDTVSVYLTKQTLWDNLQQFLPEKNKNTTQLSEIYGESNWKTHTLKLLYLSLFGFSRTPGPATSGANLRKFSDSHKINWPQLRVVWGDVGFGQLLLMVQKSQGQPPGMVLKPCKSWDKLPTSTGATAGFLNHQQLCPHHLAPEVCWFFEYWPRSTLKPVNPPRISMNIPLLMESIVWMYFWYRLSEKERKIFRSSDF